MVKKSLLATDPSRKNRAQKSPYRPLVTSLKNVENSS